MAALVCGLGTVLLLCGPTMLDIWLHSQQGFQMRIGVHWRQFESGSSVLVRTSAFNSISRSWRRDVSRGTLRVSLLPESNWSVRGHAVALALELRTSLPRFFL